MKRCGRLLLPGLLTLLASGPAAAQDQQPTPAQFDLRLALEVDTRNGVIPLTLPLVVYQHARSAELADLRVFNGQGQALPYAFVDWLPLPSSDMPAMVERVAAVFPLVDADMARGAPGTVQLEAELDAQGRLRAVRARQRPAAVPVPVAPAESALQALIVDLGVATAGEQLRELHFDLPPGAPGDYRAVIEIERSDDLRWWAPVAQSPLHWLSSRDGEQLRQDRVPLPAGSGRYLRIHWLQGAPLLFEQIRGLWRTPLTDRVAPAPELEMRFEGRPGAVAGDWVYAVPPALHAQQLALDLAEPNTVLPVSIGRYLPGQAGTQPAPGQPLRFQPQLRSTFYRLLHQGMERRSDLLGIAPFAASEWVVRPDPGVVIAGMVAPQLRLRWTPHTLLFTARGQGPFTLAVGAAPAQVDRWPDGPQEVAKVAPGFSEAELRALPPAQSGSALPRPATVAPAVVAEVGAADPDAEARARRHLLWAILVGGVLLLAVLSWRLYRQTQQGGSEAERP